MNIPTFDTLPVFEADQVLTADHLNQIRDYLEEQERLTRNKLIGIGIVCGLTYAFDDTNKIVTIKGGLGITSEGYLIIEDEPSVQLRAFKVYEDPNDDIYPPFKNNTGNQYTLYELEPQKNDNNKSLIDFDDGNLKDDYALLLYLECFDKSLKNCVENDCNDKGKNRIFTLRRLLVKKTNAFNIIKPGHNFNGRYDLEPVMLKRFKTGSANLNAYSGVYKIFLGIINDAIDNAKLQTRLSLSYTLFETILSDLYPGGNPFVSNETNLRNKYLLLEKNNPIAIQYFYDFICDVAEAYQEFRQIVFDLNLECCPPQNLFPKHLFLGPLSGLPECKPSLFRTGFLNAPNHDHQKDRLAEVRLLHEKMYRLIVNFELPAVQEIRITPSKYGDFPFSETAIPYYYKVESEGRLLPTWDPEKTRRCLPKTNLSYHAINYSTKPVVVKPLDYDISENNFLRIEGHLGQDYVNVLETISNIRNAENLPFDILALKLSRDFRGTRFDEFHCSFRDLQIIYDAWRSELSCMLKDNLRAISKQKVTRVLNRDVAAETGTPITTLADAAAEVGGSGAVFTTDRDTAKPLAEMKATGYTQSTLREEVLSAIDTSEDSYGAMMINSLKLGTRNANDYYIDSKQVLDEKYTETRDISGDDFQVAFEYPMQIMAQMVALSEIVSNDVNAISSVEVNAYSDRLNHLATNYGYVLERYPTDPNQGKVVIDRVLILRVIQAILSICSVKQLIVIEQEIEKRKKELQKLNLFSQYVKKNPGIVHRGGVPKGGTFIIVYYEKGRSTAEAEVSEIEYEYNSQVLDASGKPLTGATIYAQGGNVLYQTDDKGYLRMNVPANTDKIYVTKPGLPFYEVEVSPFDQGGVIDLGNQGKPGTTDEEEDDRIQLPSNRAVVFDFFLPYLCCSDCPPVTYCFENQPASLELDPTNYCVPFTRDEGEELPQFTVTPEGAEVTGEGVQEPDENGRVFFNPNDVDLEGGLMKVVRFAVNGEEMPLVVNVYQMPVAQFNGEHQPLEPGQNEVAVTFINSSENATSFVWDYGDDTILRTESQEPHTKIYDLSSGQTQFEVRLRAINGECSAEADPQTLIFEVPDEDIELDITPKQFCAPMNIDEEGIPLFSLVVPSDGLVAGPGVVQVGNNYGFNPNEIEFANDSDVKTEVDGFTVNGEAVPLTLTVYRMPIAAFQVSIPPPDEFDGNIVPVTFTNNSQFGVRYEWDYGDDQGSENAEPTHIHEYDISTIDGQSFDARLRVFNEIDCSSVITVPVRINLGNSSIGMRNGQNRICNGGEKYYLNVSPSGGTPVADPSFPILQDAGGFYFVATMNPGIYKITYVAPLTQGASMTLTVTPAFRLSTRVQALDTNNQSYFTRFTVVNPNPQDDITWYFWFENPDGEAHQTDAKALNPHSKEIPIQVKEVFFRVRVVLGDCVVYSKIESRFMAELFGGIQPGDNPGGGVIDNPDVVVVTPTRPLGDITIFNPGDLVSGGSTGGGGLRLATDDIGGFNVATFNDSGEGLTRIVNDNRFTDEMKNSDAVKGTVAVLNDISTGLSKKTSAKALRSGKRTEKISENLNSALKDTALRIMKANNPATANNSPEQRLLLKLYQVQVGQAINYMTLLEEDVKPRDDMAKMFTLINKQIKGMKSVGVNVNAGKALEKAINQNLKSDEEKPNLEKFSDKLLTNIKA